MQILPTGSRQSSPTVAGDYERGFTLVELLVVLLLLAVSVGAIANVSAGRREGLELRTGINKVAGTLREARSIAIRDDRQVEVVVDAGKRLIESDFSESESLIDKAFGVSTYTAETASMEPNSGAIRFFPDGTSTGGRIRLFSEEQAYNVVVDWLTGRVAIQRETE